jgi:hypothetical protein
MIQAIKILEKQIETSHNMKKFFEDALTKMNYITADSSIKFEYQKKMDDENLIILSCRKAIKALKESE